MAFISAGLDSELRGAGFSESSVHRRLPVRQPLAPHLISAAPTGLTSLHLRSRLVCKHSHPALSFESAPLVTWHFSWFPCIHAAAFRNFLLFLFGTRLFGGGLCRKDVPYLALYQPSPFVTSAALLFVCRDCSQDDAAVARGHDNFLY